MSIELALKKWCNDNLSIGKCYRPGYLVDKLGPLTENFGYSEESEERPGRLIYQDATCCQGYHAFNDIYLLEDASYDVYTSSGGEIIEHRDAIYCKNFKTLSAVLDFLIDFCRYDNNITGDFYSNMINDFELDLTNEQKRELKNKWDGQKHTNIFVPILEKCLDNEKIIKAINEIKLEPYWWQVQKK